MQATRATIYPTACVERQQQQVAQRVASYCPCLYLHVCDSQLDQCVPGCCNLLQGICPSLGQRVSATCPSHGTAVFLCSDAVLRHSTRTSSCMSTLLDPYIALNSAGEAVASPWHQPISSQCLLCLDPLPPVCADPSPWSAQQDKDTAQALGSDVSTGLTECCRVSLSVFVCCVLHR